ncbi:MAG: hypothetical protein ACRD1T_15075, partial [Acidimicrobiia bacterium]
SREAFTWCVAARAWVRYGIDNMGMAEPSKGTVQGKIWNWEGESKMGGKLMKSHYTITEISPTAYTLKWEMSVDNGPWSQVLESKTTKTVKGTD